MQAFLIRPKTSGIIWLIKPSHIDAGQRRFKFVLILSSLAAIYGAILAYRLLHYQADAVSDILKMSILIFFVTALAAFFWWSLLWRFKDRLGTVLTGALAGFLTALTVIPIPTFLGAFKRDLSAHQDIFSALQAGLEYSLATFSLAEILALPLSALVGIYVAR